MEGKQEARDCSATDSWIFSIAAALISIPLGIRRKSFAPLVFFGSTGAMLDIIVSVTNCEREFQQKQEELLKQKQQEELLAQPHHHDGSFPTDDQDLG